MFSKPWQNWLTILLAIIFGGAVVSFFLGKQQMVNPANYVLWTSQAAAAAWALWAAWKHRKVRSIKWAGILLLGTLFVFAVSGFYVGWATIQYYAQEANATQPSIMSEVLWGLNRRETFVLPTIYALGVTAVWLLGIAFFGGTWLIRQLLVGGHPVIGVARTLVDEAIRMKIVLVLVVIVTLLIALLPLTLNATERLEYRLQTFISLSTTAVWLVLALMTVFVACTSICFEIAEKQIYLTMAKSISRSQYLFGKWIGICLLNLWLITVSGLGIYASTKLLAMQPARDATDYAAVKDHILNARSSIAPSPLDERELRDVAVKRYLDLRQTEPDKYATSDIDTNDPQQLYAAYNQLAPKLREGIQNFAISQWQTIKPKSASVFMFRGVGAAKEFAHESVQLRLKPKGSPLPPDEQLRMALFVNGRPYAKPIVVVHNTVFTVDIPLALVDRNGDFELRLFNVNPADPENTFETTLTFPPGGGMEMVYPVGTFEGNLFRAMVMIYAQLVFLGMLALAAGTFLGFPVACLFCLMVLIAAVSAGFLGESLDSYASVPIAELSLWQRGVTLAKGIFDKLISGQIWEATRVFIRLFGEAILLVNPNLSAHSPIDQLVDGRAIGIAQVNQCIVRIGIASTFVTGFIGWMIWRKRELARVIV